MILLALGTNQGDRAKNLEAALLALHGAGVHPLHVSSVYETAALLPENAPPEWDIPYFNLVVTVTTELPPLALLETVKRLERELGRVDVGRWGPRLIDIDILAHGETQHEDEQLAIPHKSMLERDFVMLPLVEVAPHWRHPAAGVTAHEAVTRAGMAIGFGVMRRSDVILRWSVS
ncbi:MAG: 2-amino-4-hydroxy-6-hydroxymethyldihydropteridine diphosphokinase [Alphaproteobacteria bacterium]|nr:2-amino-4-hydroxy-6-hydroxymethyldihydropteridine diphosphokinase [Alphaproteobacteria bacterium]